ncbi:hypothetical protein Godav_000080 [Gossypium davidsonii]|uniref:Uncharacterized protein n=2 Tax=Gossypium TaxID=3633 RepID=A0A7J8T9S5_GOSDV|nr:hypothetical protein [Gossypium davidsonii]MBA0667738.1 hypothetical protein [Gossypium klotzschianum]
MPVGEQVKVDSLDVCNYYSHGSIVIFGKLIRFRIGKRTLTGELCGYFRMRFCIGAVILIGSLYSKF